MFMVAPSLVIAQAVTSRFRLCKGGLMAAPWALNVHQVSQSSVVEGRWS